MLRVDQVYVLHANIRQDTRACSVFFGLLVLMTFVSILPCSMARNQKPDMPGWKWYPPRSRLGTANHTSRAVLCENFENVIGTQWDHINCMFSDGQGLTRDVLSCYYVSRGGCIDNASEAM